MDSPSSSSINRATSSTHSLVALLLVITELLLLAQRSSCFAHSHINATSHHCPHHQKLALLQLKKGFYLIDHQSKLLSWNPDTDCCTWGGITCDVATGHVIGLDINGYGSGFARGQLDSSLFNLTGLRRLNLSLNYFDNQTIPSGWSKLSNLTHLDLTNCFLGGRVPMEFSKLTKLVYLSLSSNVFDMQPFPSWLEQLSTLTHLDLSHSGFVGQVPLQFSKLTNLVYLDLSNENATLKNPNLATLVHNLSNLAQLSLNGVDISKNNTGDQWVQAISSAMPNLRGLSLRDCGLQGPFHSSHLEHPLLSEIDMSENNLSTDASKFLGNIPSLTSLSLSNSELQGVFPQSLISKPGLVTLDIGDNPYLTVILPEFSQPSALQQLILDKASIPSRLPASFDKLTSLKILRLFRCNLTGSLSSLPIKKCTQITVLDLSSNDLTGSIPSSFGYEFQSLRILVMSDNLLEGNIPSSLFLSPSLENLFLEGNQLTGWPNDLQNASSETSSFLNGTSCFISYTSSPMVDLQSCNQSKLYAVYINDNKLSGQIPAWIWSLKSLLFLRLSNNSLESLEYPLPDLSLGLLQIVDLHSNKLSGPLPNFPISIGFQDYSNNNFTSNIPTNTSFVNAWFFSLSHNSISGEIPLSICDALALQYLDLSNNNFTGIIPKCLIEKTNNSLQVLNLRNNFFQGTLPQAFGDGCTLQTLNLYENQLEGPLPKSLVNCKELKVLDVGNNHLNDAFPFWLENVSSLRVLILKSNFFYGPIFHSKNGYPFFPSLQIFDLSSNNFTGSLPRLFFSRFETMKVEDASQVKFNNQSIKYYLQQSGSYYQDTVTIRTKGLNLEVVKVLNALIVIDLSRNKFGGEIPGSIGDLNLLWSLNFSQNNFIEKIPISMEKLILLESLDLSQNHLSGKIPWQLTKLTFLAVLNLSVNSLIGEIPQTRQFLTFKYDSFLGNIGLCGPPLSKTCEDSKNTSETFEKGEAKIDRRTMWIGFGLGYGVGLAVILWTLVLWEKGSRKYIQLLDRISRCM